MKYEENSICMSAIQAEQVAHRWPFWVIHRAASRTFIRFVRESFCAIRRLEELVYAPWRMAGGLI